MRGAWPALPITEHETIIRQLALPELEPQLQLRPTVNPQFVGNVRRNPDSAAPGRCFRFLEPQAGFRLLERPLNPNGAPLQIDVRPTEGAELAAATARR